MGPGGRVPFQTGSKIVAFTQESGELAIDSAPFAGGGSESWDWPETARQVQKQAWSLS